MTLAGAGRNRVRSGPQGRLLVAALLLAGCGFGTGATDATVSAGIRADREVPVTQTDTSVAGRSPSTTGAGTVTGADAGSEVGALPAGLGDGARPVELSAVIEDTVAHDRRAFTQGLLIEQGRMFESAGRYGVSSLREVDPGSGEVLRSVAVDPEVFAEGLELVGDRLIQLTWREETAFVWDVDSFTLEGTHAYAGEGWGLCFDGRRLVMSDGSATLEFRDAETFEPIGSVAVTHAGAPVDRLNELECVAGYVLANVWQSTDIMVIDPGDGAVVAVVDGAPLRAMALELDPGVDVLNGIAYDETADRFHLTGKLWPVMFVVRFEPSR